MKTIIYTILLCMAFTASLSAQSSNYDNLYYEILNKSKKNSDRNKSEKYQYSNENQGKGYSDYDDYRNYKRPRLQGQRFILIQTHFSAYAPSRMEHNPIWFNNSIQQIFQNHQHNPIQYHFYPEPYVNYDQRIDIYLNDAWVSPHNVSQSTCTNPYSRNRDPNSKFNDGNRKGGPAYFERSKLITYYQTRSSRVRIDVKFTDKSGRGILRNEVLQGLGNWSNEYAKYFERTENSVRQCGPEYGCALQFPSDYSLLEKAMYSIGPKLIRLVNQ